jgi:hypothetical protein
MLLTVHLRIDPKHIRLEAPERAISIRLANQVAYDSRRITLISYGKSAEALQVELGTDWREYMQHTTFAQIFDPKSTGPIFDYQVIDLLMQRLQQQLSPGRTLSLGQLFKIPLEIKAEIQDYKLLSLGRQRELEYHLQDFQRAHRLWINGEDRTISLRWRVIQNWVGWVLRLLIPIMMLFGGFLTIFTRQDQQISQFLGTAAGWIAASILAYFLGTILWMLIFRKVLPTGYLRFQLRSSGALMRRPTRWLAEKLL